MSIETVELAKIGGLVSSGVSLVAYAYSRFIDAISRDTEIEKASARYQVPAAAITRILAQFSDEPTKLQALKVLLGTSEKESKETLELIEQDGTSVKIVSQRRIRNLSRNVAALFGLLAVVAFATLGLFRNALKTDHQKSRIVSTAPSGFTSPSGSTSITAKPAINLSKWYWIKRHAFDETLRVYLGPGDREPQRQNMTSEPVAAGPAKSGQQWRFYQTGEDAYKIQAGMGGQYLNATHPADPNAVNHHPASSSEWITEWTYNGNFRLKSMETGKYISVLKPLDVDSVHGLQLVAGVWDAEEWTLIQQGDIK